MMSNEPMVLFHYFVSVSTAGLLLLHCLENTLDAFERQASTGAARGEFGGPVHPPFQSTNLKISNIGFTI